MMLTQKGWFGLCPVYIGDLDTGCPLLIERHWSLMPLMVMSEWFFAAIMFTKSWRDPDYEPAWPIKVTGNIEPRPAPQ